MIFVVDSADVDRLPEARRELQELLDQDVLKESTLLVLANKQDLENALTPLEVAERMGVLGQRREAVSRLQVLPVTARTGQGLKEALEWLLATLADGKRDLARG